MKENLVIVESPSKSKTIEKYLGSNYKVIASMGHIRNLKATGKYGLGIDVEHNFETTYELIKGKGKFIKELKKDIKNYKHIYLATDPDREGEGISWHLKDALGIKEDQYYRVVFNEVTKDAILEAFKNVGKIDENLVKSQETRRILDRIIGFRLSNLMQRKTSGKSAGRVQSVAVKLIVDREREINSFIPKEYWIIKSIFEDFEATLFRYLKDDLEISTEAEADKIIEQLKDEYIVESVEKKDRKRSNKLAFTTSSLQQEASNKLGFPSKKTMKIAQTLYEGINLAKERVGLITYMRTDAVRLSDEFVKQTKEYIVKEYGKEYIGEIKASKNSNSQDAHESIRPTSIMRTPESVKEYLSNDEFKLYELIYLRTLSAIMADAKIKGTTIILDNNGYKFKLTGQILAFDGYLKVYSKYENSEDKILPNIEEGEIYTKKDIEKSQHFTEPPSRYTEAKLIKELEEKGIGRPSTYAGIISIIQERDYVKLEKKSFIPTDIGFVTTDKLQEGFSSIINVEYTANMENDLDKIAEGKINNIQMLREFYNNFENLIDKANKEMKSEITGEKCPECGSDLVYKKSRYGRFEACSNYPNCKYIKNNSTSTETKNLGQCPQCKSDLVERKSKYGTFIACSNYPNCKYIQKNETTNKIEVVGKCPKCEHYIVPKKTKKGTIFYGCSNYPKCDYATWDKPE